MKENPSNPNGEGDKGQSIGERLEGDTPNIMHV
jgi:hypothetical protein